MTQWRARREHWHGRWRPTLAAALRQAHGWARQGAQDVWLEDERGVRLSVAEAAARVAAEERDAAA